MKKISVRTLPNGYDLTVDSKQYLCLSESKLVHSMFMHVSLDEASPAIFPEADDIVEACATYRHEGEAMLDAMDARSELAEARKRIATLKQDADKLYPTEKELERAKERICRLLETVKDYQDRNAEMRKENAALKRDLAAARKVVSETKEKPSETKEKAKSAKEINSSAQTKPAKPAKHAKPTPAKKPRPKKPAPLLPNQLSDEQREHIDVIRAALKVHIIDTGLPNRCLGHMINVGGTENNTIHYLSSSSPLATPSSLALPIRFSANSLMQN